MAYTNIDDPSAHFQALAYTASTATPSQTFTNDGNSDLKPDWLWIKNRSGWGSRSHNLFDSSRGVNKRLKSDTTAAEDTTSYQTFNTNGFTVPEGFEMAYSAPYVAWQWKANGGTTATNNDGTVTTTTQVNSDAGFSIVTWAGGGTGTIGHGLGETPDMWIIKNRDYAVSWAVGFSNVDIMTRSKYLQLNQALPLSTYNNLWGTSDAQINSTTIGAAGDRMVNISGNDYVGYFFKGKQGFSKFGSYFSNGSTDGPFIYTGFKPAMIIAHRASGQNKQWLIKDNARNPFNEVDFNLYPNSDSAETNTSIRHEVDFLSNGFKIRDQYDLNQGGGTFIYMAFAENPFVTSTGIPTTAR